MADFIVKKKRKVHQKYVVHCNGQTSTKTKYEDMPTCPTLVFEQEVPSEPIPGPELDPACLYQCQDKENHKCYQTAKVKRLENWEKLFPKLLMTGRSKNVIKEAKCNKCKLSPVDGPYRCIDCICSMPVCLDCLTECHPEPHLHIFEKWLNGVYTEYIPDLTVWKLDCHELCAGTYDKEMIVIDDKGRQHLKKIQFFTCEDDAVTLLQFGLWPSSPKMPRLAFHVELLYWLNSLLLECHVSTKGFCEALKARQTKLRKPLVNRQVREIYKTLMNETIHQFRQYAYQLDNPVDLFPEIDDGSSCPACFEAKRVIYCFDADFQLVRKSSSGYEWVVPKHEGRFFIQQNIVDEFIKSYNSPYIKKDCSDFQAGSDLRSKGKNQKLSETAVFGATCRHDLPQKFFSLKHGERLGYAVFLLEYFLRVNNDKNLHVSYDIACLLEKHLKKCNRDDILSKVSFSVPIFHCYGHSFSCQVMFNPRKLQNLGLTDGEGIERLWSYLGGFSRITKEMSPENRTDLLTDGLLHYSRKMKDKLGDALISKYKRAITLGESSNASLCDLLKELPDDVDPNEAIQAWIMEEKRLAQKHTKETKSLQGNQDLKKQKIEQLQKLAVERHYLLRLTKRYAKGQSIFIRLSKQLNAVFKKISKCVEQYNEMEPAVNFPGSISFDIVKDVDSQFYKCLSQPLPHSGVPVPLRQEILNFFFLKERCTEEEVMLKNEMHCVVKWHENQYTKIQHIIFNNTLTDVERSILLNEAIHLEKVITNLHVQFCDFIELTPFICHFTFTILKTEDDQINELFSYIKCQEDLDYACEIDSDTDESEDDN